MFHSLRRTFGRPRHPHRVTQTHSAAPARSPVTHAQPAQPVPTIRSLALANIEGAAVPAPPPPGPPVPAPGARPTTPVPSLPEGPYEHFLDALEPLPAPAPETERFRLQAERYIDSDEEDVPNEWLCPITRTLMRDPVVIASGHTFERQAVATWLSRHNTNPLTNQPLAHGTLVPNLAIKEQLANFRIMVRRVQQERGEKR